MEWGAGDWVRPVSAREGKEVSEYERQYEDGSDPRVLDIVNIPVLEPRPKNWQTENWLLDPELYWQKEGTCSWFDLSAFVDPVAPLWVNGYCTYHGLNDKIPLDSMMPVSSSLRLIRVERLELTVFRPGEAFGNCYLTISLGETYEGACYKLVAAVIECDRR